MVSTSAQAYIDITILPRSYQIPVSTFGTEHNAVRPLLGVHIGTV